jgi:hypothetical protein
VSPPKENVNFNFDFTAQDQADIVAFLKLLR